MSSNEGALFVTLSQIMVGWTIDNGPEGAEEGLCEELCPCPWFVLANFAMAP